MEINKLPSIEKKTIEKNYHSHLPKWFSHVWGQEKQPSIESDQALDQQYEQLISRFKIALETTALIVLVNDTGAITYVSEEFCDLLDYSESELIGVNYLSLQHRSFKERELFSNTLASQKITSFEMIPLKKSGNPLILKTQIMPLIKSNQESDIFLIMHRDVTRLKQAEKVIKELGAVDTLTGLPNRDKFERDVRSRIEMKHAEKFPFAILFFDLDRFKFYNDTLGHFTGDKLIQSISQTLSSIQHKKVQIYRYGGDEFSVLFHSPKSKEEVQELAQEILLAFESPFHVKGNELYITASIGISYFPVIGVTYDQIIQQAEMAMHYAKELGKGDFQWYQSSIRTEHDEKLLMEKRLRIAMEQENFELYYHPQIDLKENKVIGVEALLRWNDEQLGKVSPYKFIPIAEETGLINQIGDWVLEKACIQAKKWNNEGHELRIGINISPQQFQRPDFVSKVKNTLDKTGLSPKLLDLEITENDLLYNRDECLKTLYRLKQFGVSISIDDFGTGYSSLSYLRRFPIDTLKIDQSFIKEVVDNTNDQAIVTSIIQLAHNMKLRVIAEGVETSEMVAFLNKLSCDEMQGFLYSQPLPPEAVTKYIESTSPSMKLNV
ncbi:sensor domain-containing protein [Evansella cellulosilytica]|uniref:Diguanylate cyclase/phosphodiesterase with PAS/PAC sensor(S) n=1 Tax=Evansella cellulosilytica (strain ATCC 21833 / DSM 2522 / FERM P-1141 / JCM 9156 / N-4) TaxID=649639 RepID=E6TYR4_EVAC2|nr:EAL domain-containing protein [Evansella cellulosilytica]ADU31249.1 diguanylate cyclase/phosphodiesterase with PAS/PAC sensor(s) [Evansella cellulosilytica DSM 2522]